MLSLRTSASKEKSDLSIDEWDAHQYATNTTEQTAYIVNFSNNTLHLSACCHHGKKKFICFPIYMDIKKWNSSSSFATQKIH